MSDLNDAVVRCNTARDFPNNSCPASRFVQITAEDLAWGMTPHVFLEEPQRIAESMLAVLTAL